MKKYVAASTTWEAEHRFLARLTHETVKDAFVESRRLHEHDSCEPKCRYDIFEVSLKVENVEDGYGL